MRCPWELRTLDVRRFGKITKCRFNISRQHRHSGDGLKAVQVGEADLRPIVFVKPLHVLERQRPERSEAQR